MGAFLNNLYEEGTPTEIAYWIGKRVMQLEISQNRTLTPEEKPDYRIICNGSKEQLLRELAKIE